MKQKLYIYHGTKTWYKDCRLILLVHNSAHDSNSVFSVIQIL